MIFSLLPPALLLPALLAGDAATGGSAPRSPTAAETAVAPLTFQFAGCPDDLARDVEELVRADVSWAPGDPPAALTVRCEEAGVTLLLAGDDAGVAERKLALATTPPQARARTAALVATELILMGRKPVPPVLPARRATAVVEASEPVAVVSAAPPRPTAAHAGQRAALLAVLGTSLQNVAGDVPMFFAGARGRLPARPAFELAADVAALYQRRTSRYGTSQAFGGELSLLAEARLGFSGGATRAGLGVRAVALRVAGSDVPDTVIRTSSAWGAAVGPIMRLSVSGEGRHGVGELALAGGWCGPDVVGTAGGGSPVGVGGWWASVSVGAGWLSE